MNGNNITYPPLSEVAEGMGCCSYANALFISRWKKTK